MAMIELIFAIVIIAISILSIPSIMTVANEASKQAVIDEDVMSRLAGWMLDKSQARWDLNYQASGTGPLWITATADLGCSRGGGDVWYRANPHSTVQCQDQNLSPSTIPSTGDGNLSRGIEQLNGGSEPITVTAATGEDYAIAASYAVRYVDSTIAVSGNTATATWKLGSSTAMSPDGSTGTVTHLKRVVTRFKSDDQDVDMALTFFKSNKGN